MLGIDNSDIYNLDLHTMTWTVRKEAKPEELDSIDEHTTWAHGDSIYVFGGNIYGFKSNKLFAFNTKSGKWETKNTTNAPPERSSHSAIIKDGKMYIFGGKDIENNKLGDFWVYDITSNEWNQIKFEEDEGPISRSGHSTGVFKNFIVIYGGIHELTQELSDMYLYDTTRNSWMMVFEEEHSPVYKQQSHHSSFSQSGKLSKFLEFFLIWNHNKLSYSER